jgi:hypothetical protein
MVVIVSRDMCARLLPCQSRGVEGNSVLSESSCDGRVQRLASARLVDVGMLQVREVAVCRAVRHIGEAMSLKKGQGILVHSTVSMCLSDYRSAG